MESKRFDLHVHTTASDGDFNAVEILEEAKKNNVVKMAITDHDTVGNVKNVIEAAKNTDIEIIPGVEFSVNIEKGQLHILGYGMDIENEVFLKIMSILQNARVFKNEKIVEILNRDGFEITLDEVKAKSIGDSIGRPHFAKVMIEKGYVKDAQEAFSKYLVTPEIEDLKRKSLTDESVIKLINDLGGIAVLAHPHSLKLNDEELFEKVKKFKSYGLKGIEVFHSNHSVEEFEKYSQIAKKLDLIETCGSDYHGPITKPHIDLGYGRVRKKDETGNWMEINPIMPTTNFELYNQFVKCLNENKKKYESKLEDYEFSEM